MTTDRTRQPKGIPVGGQFAATAHGEAGVTLAARTPAFPELAPYGEIPAPLESQNLANGAPVEATFEESYRAFFRPLDDHEAVHGPYETQRPTSEGEILDLAGLRGVDLGRVRSAFLERDEDTGEPVILVHTRNGGGNRDCYADTDLDCGKCTGCVQTHVIPALPTYLRDEDDDEDYSYANNYFRPVDPAAGLAAIEAQEQRVKLNELVYYRTAIAEGKQPPWVVLSPVRAKTERDELLHSVQKLREQAGYRARDRRHADAVKDSIRDGAALPSAGMVRVPNSYYSYGTALQYRDEYQSAAREARAAADALASEMGEPLPPVVTALVNRELEKLDGEASKREAKAAENEAKIDETGAVLKSWAGIVHRDADNAVAAADAAKRKLEDFDWSASFPGDPDDCPPRPADS